MRENNNIVSLIGKITSGFTFSHESNGEKFYMVDIEIQRLSDTVDVIPMMISDRLIDVTADFIGCMVRVGGQFRSYNEGKEGQKHLRLYVFVTDISLSDELAALEDLTKANSIYLSGYVCKNPIHRKTPFGRYITDVLIAVNRSFGKTDYIPIICWGRNAAYASKFQVGTRICVGGRIQSRGFAKRLDNGEFENRVAYEVSVRNVEVLDRNKEVSP